MFSPHLSGQFNHIFDFPMELVAEDLHLSQTREGGGQQVAPLGILPEHAHDFIVLLWHGEEVMADVPIESDEANVGFGFEAAQAVDAPAHPLGYVPMAVWSMFGVPSDQYRGCPCHR